MNKMNSRITKEGQSRVPTRNSRKRGEEKHVVKLTKRGAYLNMMTGGATRGGTHQNRKKELSRNFCRKS